MEQQHGNSGSARSARKRIQVGATNRSSSSSHAAIPASAAAEGGSSATADPSDARKDNGNTNRLRKGRTTSVGNLRRPDSPAVNGATIQRHHAASRQVSALALSSRGADQVSSFRQKHKIVSKCLKAIVKVGVPCCCNNSYS